MHPREMCSWGWLINDLYALLRIAVATVTVGILFPVSVRIGAKIANRIGEPSPRRSIMEFIDIKPSADSVCRVP